MHTRTRQLLAAIGGVVATFAVAACSASTTAPAAPAHAATSHAAPHPAQHTTDPRAAVRAWWHSGVHADFNRWVGLMGAVSRDGAAGDVAALRVDCGRFADTTRTLQADPPPPMRKLRVEWRASLAAALESANDCLAGDYVASAAAIKAATRHIHRETAILQR